MRPQLLSDLHPRPSPRSRARRRRREALVLGGDIDATWAGLERFQNWPVPVLFVAGNHEFDGRELMTARRRCAMLRGARLHAARG